MTHMQMTAACVAHVQLIATHLSSTLTHLSFIPRFTVYPSTTSLSLTDAVLMCVAQRCTLLTQLNVERSSITDRFIIELAAHCPLIDHLNIGSCKSITDAAIVEVSHRCKLLKCLKMNACALISDVSLLALSSRCDAVVELSVDHCTLVTDVGVCAIAALSRLTHLNVFGCQVTVASVEALLRCCTLQAVMTSSPRIGSTLEGACCKHQIVAAH